MKNVEPRMQCTRITLHSSLRLADVIRAMGNDRQKFHVDEQGGSIPEIGFYLTQHTACGTADSRPRGGKITSAPQPSVGE